MPNNPLWFALLALLRPGMLCRRLAAAQPQRHALWRTGLILILFAACAHGLVLEALRPEPRGLLDAGVLGPIFRIVIFSGVGLWLGAWLAVRVSALNGRSDRDEHGLAVAVVALVPVLLGLILNPLPLPWGRVVVVAGCAWGAVLLWRASGSLLGLPPGERTAFVLVIITGLAAALVAIGWPVVAVVPGAW